MLGRNVVFNLIGALATPLVSVLVIPKYLHLIGPERFGILALIWLIFGYFGLFDFGLSRATANSLAKIRDPRSSAFSETFWTALALNASLGVAGSLVFAAAAPFVLARLPMANSELSAEVARSLPWIAALIPLATIGGVFTGVLEATERFFILNLIQVFGTLLFQPLPLLFTILFGPDVETAVVASTLARLIAVVAAGAVAIRMTTLSGGIRPRWRIGRDLLRYGSWVTVTNLISPILVSVDQFMIGGMLGAAAITYYSVPFSLSMKALILPAAVTRALFPRTSGLPAAEALALSTAAVKTVALLLSMVIAPAILLSHEGLTLWIGADFAAQATTTAQVLLVATWINGIAWIPFSLLQSQGRPDLVAKYHAIEILPFVAFLWLMMTYAGLWGAAVAWLARASLDAVLLFGGCGFLRRDIRQVLPASVPIVTASILAAAMHPGPVLALVLAVLHGLALAWLAIETDPVVRSTVLHLTSRLGSRFGRTTFRTGKTG